MKRVVVIGGGHGQSTILRGIKEIADIEISAIVTVADSGGSTGRIRSFYPIPAMGDIRNVLIALSDRESLLSELMNYRFKGEGETDIVGHNLGNLIFTAMADLSGSFVGGIQVLSTLLNVKGKVIPSTLEDVSLFAMMDDETLVKGEDSIPSFNHHIRRVFYDHDVRAEEGAVKAIMEADLIIYGIGSLYTSIIPNTIIKAISDALKKTKAKRVYFANCMTQNNETYDYDLKDHLDALESHGGYVDVILKHSDHIPEEILGRYRAENSIEVIDHHDSGKMVIERELLDFSSGLVRHDPSRIRKAVEELLKEV